MTALLEDCCITKLCSGTARETTEPVNATLVIHLDDSRGSRVKPEVGQNLHGTGQYDAAAETVVREGA